MSELLISDGVQQHLNQLGLRPVFDAEAFAAASESFHVPTGQSTLALALGTEEVASQTTQVPGVRFSPLEGGEVRGARLAGNGDVVAYVNPTNFGEREVNMAIYKALFD